MVCISHAHDLFLLAGEADGDDVRADNVTIAADADAGRAQPPGVQGASAAMHAPIAARRLMPIVIKFGTKRNSKHRESACVHKGMDAHCCMHVCLLIRLLALPTAGCPFAGHDKIAAAAYRLIPTTTLSALHCHMAAQLLASWDADEQEVQRQQQQQQHSERTRAPSRRGPAACESAGVHTLTHLFPVSHVASCR
jgi:hypothetical protein